MPLSGLKELTCKVSYHYEQRSERALIDDILVHSTGKNAFLSAARFLLHRVSFALFHSERQCWQRISNQVDPQQVRRFQNSEVQHRCDEYGQNFTEVRREQELDRLTDVRVDPAALFDSCYDSSEVVVGQDHIRDVFGNVSSGDAHSDTDIRRLDRRSIVDTVTSHSCYHVVSFPRSDDPYLVLRLYSCVYRISFDLLVKLFIGHVIECCTENCIVGTFNDAEIFADSNSCIELIAGDHDRSDACLKTLGYRVLDLRSYRVDHSDETDEDQVVLKSLARETLRSLMMSSDCEGKNSQSLARHFGIGSLDSACELVCHRLDAIACEHICAVSQDYVWRALGELYEFGFCDKLVEFCIHSSRSVHLIVPVNGRHHLTSGIERSLSDTWEFPDKIRFLQVLHR